MTKKSKILLLALIICGTAAITFFSGVLPQKRHLISGAPPYGLAEKDIPSLNPWEELKRTWQRPQSSPKVGLQVGHLNSHDFPEELSNLRGNSGASGGGFTERQINENIAKKTADLLRAKGVQVDILPATVPPDYWADAFIAIHADGSTDSQATGFKIAGPWRDLTGNSTTLVSLLEEKYQSATKLTKDPNITRNMRGYYAFAWWRYEHSIHPMTTAAIVETGFVTNRSDREIIAKNPDVPATAIAEGILAYLEQRGLLQS